MSDQCESENTVTINGENVVTFHCTRKKGHKGQHYNLLEQWFYNSGHPTISLYSKPDKEIDMLYNHLKAFSDMIRENMDSLDKRGNNK